MRVNETDNSSIKEIKRHVSLVKMTGKEVFKLVDEVMIFHHQEVDAIVNKFHDVDRDLGALCQHVVFEEHLIRRMLLIKRFKGWVMGRIWADGRVGLGRPRGHYIRVKVIQIDVQFLRKDCVGSW